jgi:hypothetical protein
MEVVCLTSFPALALRKRGVGGLPECDKPKQIFIYGSRDFDILCQLLVAPFSKPIS